MGKNLETLGVMVKETLGLGFNAVESNLIFPTKVRRIIENESYTSGEQNTNVIAVGIWDTYSAVLVPLIGIELTVISDISLPAQILLGYSALCATTNIASGLYEWYRNTKIGVNPDKIPLDD